MTQPNPVYLDYAATTPVDPRVQQVMMAAWTANYGNPSSVHWFGQRAEAALESAREAVAAFLNAHPSEIYFTSCGTESDNLALRGVARARRMQTGANHILVSPVEHSAVLHTAQQLAALENFDLELLPVDAFGRVDPASVASRLRSSTALVSVVYANNEIGSINPISEVGQVCRQAGIPFHTDAVQAAAYLPMDVQVDNLDLLSLGAHKLYGPKSGGVLFVRHGVPIQAVQTGGKQENGLRAGTQDIPSALGVAEALRLIQLERDDHTTRFLQLRDRLIAGVLSSIPDARLTGHPRSRLPNHASFVFEDVDGNTLLALLDAAGFACSSGSACKSGSPRPSEILLALEIPPEWALGSLRVTVGRYTTPEDIENFLTVLPQKVTQAHRGEGK